MEWIYKYFSLTAVIAGVGFLVKHLIQRKIDSYFNKRLEDHKQELTIMSEKAKYDISKKLFDFEAYATKKHTVYPELYQRVFEFWNEIIVFTQKLDMLIEADKNQHDKISILDRLGEDGMNEALELFQKSKKTFDYFTMNELFLSREVSISCAKTLKSIRKVNTKLQSQLFEDCYNPFLTKGGITEIWDEVFSFKEVIYKELSYSHFENTEEKVQ
ncbi:hypothetical protein ABES08_16945 [Peribacillus simplex]|uniref:hypothetical protein n=1 Tax=Peribacillus simplex TaxID=1478 RepID=UPI003D27B802